MHRGCIRGAAVGAEKFEKFPLVDASIFRKAERALFLAIRKWGCTRNMISPILALSKSPEDKKLKIQNCDGR